MAALLSRVVPSSGAPVVVELGPGTGSVSDAISARLPTAGRHLAVEVDGGLVAHLRRTRPHVETLCGDAEKLGSLLTAAGIEGVDAVVCTLPWSILGATKQRAILDQVAVAVLPGAGLSTVADSHARWLSGARDLRVGLDRRFDEVIPSRIIWRNVPPAMVYVCRRPSLVDPRAAPHGTSSRPARPTELREMPTT
ncbi:class I SAM-dependent methyltransferase [Rhodococcus sp. ACT016]|uniref:class I SAM-dependent methyltransferase n=1 Tax=Rhodococcus sp. ACT016 TaxID=3134808 RepID=UPI003D2E830B